MNYAQLAFSDISKALQEANGSRKNYERVEKYGETEGLSENEVAFIEDRDSLYLATIGENGYPYVQHRGGPKGFVKVLDNKTIGFVDFTGNKQYISLGNIYAKPQASIIMVSYPQQARLKLYANVRIVSIDEDKTLFDLLDPKEYKHRPERMMLFDIKAYDWNCPQHIMPRFTEEEVNQVLDTYKVYIKSLEEEIKKLKEA